MRAAIQARVSTFDQEPQNQLAELRSFRLCVRCLVRGDRGGPTFLLSSFPQWWPLGNGSFAL